MNTRRESRIESRELERCSRLLSVCPRRSTLDARPSSAAFTLMEVMIAGGILFVCLFAILALISNGLQNARVLQKIPVDPAGKLAAEASLNLKLMEGSDSGDFGRLYPDYRWSSETNPIGTNSLFQLDFVVYRRTGGRPIASHMSILLYRPDSPRTPTGGLH